MMIRSGPLSAAILLFTGSVATQAAEFSITPRVTGGVQDYEMDVADVTTTAADGSLSFRDGFTIGDNLSFYGGGVTIARGRFFADLSGQISQSGADNTTIFQGTSGNTGNVGHTHILDATFDRTEYNATLGWAITEQLSAYAGYKRASLDLKQARSPVLSPPPESGDVLQLGDYFMDFTYNGLFVGATYSVPVKTWGAVSIQTSIAKLRASFEQRFEGAYFIISPFGAFFLDPNALSTTVRGDSTGFNFGVSWTGSFGGLNSRLQGLSYTVGIDHSLYQFETPNSPTDAGVGADLEERNTRVRLDLRYRFTVAKD